MQVEEDGDAEAGAGAAVQDEVLLPVHRVPLSVSYPLFNTLWEKMATSFIATSAAM